MSTSDQIDAEEQLDATARNVGTRTLEAGQARVTTLAQTYLTDVADLWDAVTDTERIPRWFLPVSGDLRLGGHYQLEGNAGGTVQICDPPHAFTATWEYGGEVSWIEVGLRPDGDGARLTLEHIAHVDDERWAEYGPGATGVGWDLALVGLRLHLNSGETVDPQTVEQWLRGPGTSFVADCSTAWAAASQAAGTDPEAAQAAAERTTAFYQPATQEHSGP